MEEKIFDFKDVNVSVFRNFKVNTPDKTMNLFDWLKDPIHKKNVIYLRSLNTKEERKEVKALLSCVTSSGTFSPTRKVENLLKHSGVICIDIDADDNPHIKDFRNLKTQICNINNVAYCSLSASGNGVFCIIPIMYTDRHKEHFESLKRDFEMFNITVDKSCSDVSRLRICSYDENAFINYRALVYKKTIESTSNQKKNSFSIQSKSVYKKLPKENSTRNKVESVISVIEENKIDITGDYQQWFQIGCALANEFGEDGRELFHTVSSFSHQYHLSKTDRQFNQCLEQSYDYKIGTFFHWAAEAGIV